ncbi:MAG: serine hydrolase domain-containing protein, partial [Saprospiraceae bacterium]|nr:serine hydrolase domain-containing protein [Saprospiraceae bacterium]
MKKQRLLVTGCLLFLLTLSWKAFGQNSSPVLDSLDAYFEKMVIDWGVPSMSIGIVMDDSLVFAQSYGTRKLGESLKPDPQTVYAIASNTKAFTSTMIGMLVDEGSLNWDDPVSKYVPEFELHDPYVSQLVTVRDLLCHRVGLGTYSGDVIWYKSNLNADQLIKRIRHIPLQYEFRNGYGYSNLMYITAGQVIENVTGKTWVENVQERILDPLGMKRTIANIDRLKEVGNVATPHSLLNGKNIVIDWVDWSQIAAMGGLISSVEDMAKWMIFNLNHGVWGGDTLFSSSVRNQLWKPHNNFTVDHIGSNPFNRHFSGYGLGWGLSDYHGRLRVSHTGGFDGMLSAVNLIPDEKLGVVVLTNGMKSPMMAA